MKLSTAIASLAVAGSAVAAPPAGSKPFQIMSLRSASPIHFGQVSASKSNIFLNAQKQDAVCEVKDKSKAPTEATFYIKDEVLYLYTGKGPVQKAFVDRSGMGQGKLGYLSGNGPLPPRFEDKGWKVDKAGDLNFNGKNLIACPGSKNGPWTVWVATDNLTPGGNKGCLGFSARTLPSENPVRCRYSQ
ncbi:cell wall protein phiA [Hirsutella rhossiliensis]|uniref:Cell wall protein phiA n=1 Tax=Hirsutella rhossiliensis TaxID=111463 RepID=A0A9P8MS13_9HYPO|nr:cell wall protein phiA [Hirsutella rhossiliensis]KAH0959156.1 cell wall protein phiA [Hirsutella rhossiliensis]